ncbi:telomerase RNA component interacting RNase [Hypomesus transpacificus]|uniref:telomerase RNA component interacting RNase n=1 Tax=Hypomesus transpacificus TaxID=137520 RepID=UPI001F087FAA|nr:telomerase RNA component interacting RNase [Hypomesus transpacificus]
MEPKRGYSKNAHSSSDSSSNSPASPGGGKTATANAFANDGSFMEMFKKKMEEERRKKQLEPGCSDKSSAEEGQSTPEKKPPPLTSFVGKRRGGAKLALKTGMVAKKQKLDSKESGKSDAWSMYMAEVKKYKAHQCGDDDKTRPLVK